MIVAARGGAPSSLTSRTPDLSNNNLVVRVRVRVRVRVIIVMIIQVYLMALSSSTKESSA